MDIVGLPSFVSSKSTSAERMHWVQVTFESILELYHESVLRVQRNHTRRAKEARHILSGDNPLHSNFLAARTPDGKLRLIDGYTRVTAVVHGGKTAPILVWLGVADVDGLAAADKLYDAVDSRAAVKRGRDSFEEGLRRANLLDKLESPAFVRAQVVSAVVAAAAERDVRTAVFELKKGLLALDSIGLRAGKSGLPAGAVAGLLLIANQAGVEAKSIQSFAMALQSPESVTDDEKANLQWALACAEVLKERRESNALSGKNVQPIMELILGHWVAQVDDLDLMEPVTREVFLARQPA